MPFYAQNFITTAKVASGRAHNLAIALISKGNLFNVSGAIHFFFHLHLF